YYSVHISEIRKLISYINSDDWEGSTKPIITKITKAIKDKKQESEFDKVKKNDRKESKEMFDKIIKKLENQSLEK
ncbi:15359_t:CDS:2, partial [Gigaspora rosea]